MSTRVALIGAEFEENLSLRYLASSLEHQGFTTLILPYNESNQTPGIVEKVLAAEPHVVGISVPFQSRALDLLAIAAQLRLAGFDGHVTVGGHFATFESDKILRDFPAIDSVVRQEGEHTLRELCACLQAGAPTHGLAGLVSRRGQTVVSGPRRPLPPLDELPFPRRPRLPHTVMGVRSSPILASRGCYADCSFCCINAYARSARGPRYRQRSPENILHEMQHEYHERHVRLFVFHDDNFLVPSLSANLRRYRRLAELLHAEGLDDIGIVIKCRPNDVHPELLDLLRSMGLIRAYIGIETNSDEGILSLNRRITSDDNRRALRILQDLEIYSSFNVLIFDPEATLEGIESNLDFMEEFSTIPFNFCRAEIYAGTSLKERLEAQGRLRGDYMAWDYRMRDPRVELLFRIASTVFRPRNFKPDGVANLNMGVRFDAEVVRHFHPECWDPALQSQLVEISRVIGTDSVQHMRDILRFVGSKNRHNNAVTKDFTVELARRIARSDLDFLRQIRAARRKLDRRLATVLHSHSHLQCTNDLTHRLDFAR